uniref:Putative LAGLIDADG homing endonuclease n=1 Tax=Symbiochloris handae TaxID=1853882 RepID=A0A097KJL2_9CHLO|nr:putative LAGLIDADG homing endonuclease [Symbiochloris handae]AIT93381.1 putative LAGLIDADG homing endonuclease [Symbiochloris handae]
MVKEKNSQKPDDSTIADCAYIAGFLDGDGCINAQIVARNDYRLKYQIRLSVTFFQRSKRKWLLLWLKKKIGSGTLRERSDGMCEYAIFGPQGVKSLLIKLSPFLKGKRRQAMLTLGIIERLSRKQSKEDFLRLCRVADKFGLLNDSKRRTITSQVVEKTLGDL